MSVLTDPGSTPRRALTHREGPLLVVGLGNPGTRYAHNRHNIGFQVVERLAARHGFSFIHQKGMSGLLASGYLHGRRLLLLKPQSYMNESGRAVRAARDFYRVDDHAILVVYDDLDLPFATFRFRPEGGAGGQRGVRSIIQHLGDGQFARLRIGIDRPPGRMDPAAYVLQDFSKAEEKELALRREEAVDGIELWMTDGIVAAMNRYN
ncbi:MAG: aminoacyl-tRNA hydrolase [Anaerolineales bacterium]|nr:aminoacyl-tRNA hydrolase [Anaerolineales bacterium]MCB9129160.1 aminoacyl-tRNA hydrolase [Ardenticatenales bacterium]